jgi:hypothetical protein
MMMMITIIIILKSIELYYVSEMRSLNYQLLIPKMIYVSEEP